MLGKLGLYAHTIRYLRPGQILWRIVKGLGGKCALQGAAPARLPGGRYCLPLPELDHDTDFLKRFSTEELLEDRVTFLYEGETVCWEGSWKIDSRTPLWNFNLHYFEYLHPLVREYRQTGDPRLLDKTVQMIRGWIRRNPREQGGDGWAPYTLSLRLTNWMAYMAAVGDQLEDAFREEVEDSLFGQYAFLAEHLEKHILGNHYFENLKALVLCALYFGDTASLDVFLREFRRECREEILPDGTHFELSPMYHKIVLEGLLRVAVTLAAAGMPDEHLEELAGDMLSAACSMEDGLARTPLFNDSGDNVAKSLQALVKCAGRLGITPVFRQCLPEGGYYFLEKGPWRLIVDAGAAGASYIPGHAHCDAMSFELYRDGMPVLVNCGTYAYQWAQRHRFRSTQAHNTVQVADVEQSEIWSVFRLGRRSKTRVLEVTDNRIRMEMTDYRGNRIRRELRLEEDALYIRDRADGLRLRSYVHSVSPRQIRGSGEITQEQGQYAPEFGRKQTVYQYTATGNGCLELTVPLA